MEDDLKSLCSIVFWIKLLFPAVIVFGAMYWAQSIFNGNARKRENRERRLLRLEDMIELSVSLIQSWNSIRSSLISADDIREHSITLTTYIIKLRSYAQTYGFEVTDSIDDFQDIAEKITDAVFDLAPEYELKENTKTIVDDVIELSEFMKAGRHQKKILDTLKSLHTSIESEH